MLLNGWALSIQYHQLWIHSLLIGFVSTTWAFFLQYWTMSTCGLAESGKFTWPPVVQKLHLGAHTLLRKGCQRVDPTPPSRSVTQLIWWSEVPFGEINWDKCFLPACHFLVKHKVVSVGCFSAALLGQQPWLQLCKQAGARCVGQPSLHRLLASSDTAAFLFFLPNHTEAAAGAACCLIAEGLMHLSIKESVGVHVSESSCPFLPAKFSNSNFLALFLLFWDPYIAALHICLSINTVVRTQCTHSNQI